MSAPSRKQYRVLVEGWVLGEARKKGARVDATDAEAKNLLTAGIIELFTEPAKETSAPATRPVDRAVPKPVDKKDG